MGYLADRWIPDGFVLLTTPWRVAYAEALADPDRAGALDDLRAMAGPDGMVRLYRGGSLGGLSWTPDIDLARRAARLAWGAALARRDWRPRWGTVWEAWVNIDQIQVAFHISHEASWDTIPGTAIEVLVPPDQIFRPERVGWACMPAKRLAWIAVRHLPWADLATFGGLVAGLGLMLARLA